MLPQRGQHSRAIPTEEGIHAEMRSPGGMRCSQPFIPCPHTFPNHHMPNPAPFSAGVPAFAESPRAPGSLQFHCAPLQYPLPQALVAPHRVPAVNRQLPCPTTPVLSHLDSKSLAVGTSPRFLKHRGNLWCNKYDLK